MTDYRGLDRYLWREGAVKERDDDALKKSCWYWIKAQEGSGEGFAQILSFDFCDDE